MAILEIRLLTAGDGHHVDHGYKGLGVIVGMFTIGLIALGVSIYRTKSPAPPAATSRINTPNVAVANHRSPYFGSFGLFPSTLTTPPSIHVRGRGRAVVAPPPYEFQSLLHRILAFNGMRLPFTRGRPQWGSNDVELGTATHLGTNRYRGDGYSLQSAPPDYAVQPTPEMAVSGSNSGGHLPINQNQTYLGAAATLRYIWGRAFERGQ